MSLPALDAIVLPPRRASLDDTRFAGVRLVERAVLALHRAGVERILVSPETGVDAGAIGRLARRGAPATMAPSGAMVSSAPDRATIFVSADVVFEPRAIHALIAQGEDQAGRAVAAAAALGGVLVYVPAALRDRLAGAPSPWHALWALYRERLMRLVDLGSAFCRPVPSDGRVWEVEADSIRRQAGTGDAWTRAIRSWSVPASQVLIRAGASPAGVTLLGLALLAVAAWQLAVPGYWPGVLGALAFFASVVASQSADEIACAGFADDPASASWMNAAATASYIAPMGGLAVGRLLTEGPGPQAAAALVAVGATAIAIRLTTRFGRLSGAGAHTDTPEKPDPLLAALSGSAVGRFVVATRFLVARPLLAYAVLVAAAAGRLSELAWVWAGGAVVVCLLVTAAGGVLARDVVGRGTRQSDASRPPRSLDGGGG